jgi:CheY-like chemotaxis protein
VAAKLLIADDSTTIQKVFERTFPPEEFTLSFANNGEEALTKARTDKPNAIIADINMPAKNGFELCEELKRDPVLRGTPVLLLIGILDDFDEDEGRRVGADGFIIKPFESNAAISKVREALAKGATAQPTAGPAGGGAEEILDLTNIASAPAATPPPQKKGAEDILNVADILEESPAQPAPTKEKTDEVMDLSDITATPAPQPPEPPQKKGAEDILNVADILEESPAQPAPTKEKTEEIMDLSDITAAPAPQPPEPPQKKGAEDILNVADILEESPAQPAPTKEKADEVMDLTDMAVEPSGAPSPSEKAAEDIFELPDIAEETPTAPPPQEQRTDDIFEIPDIELEPTATPPSTPSQEKKEGEEFVLKTSLRDLEEELKAEFPEEKRGVEQELEAELKMESSEEAAEVRESLSEPVEENFGSLELDLPFDDDSEPEPRPKDADWTTLFGELGLDESGEEVQQERLGSILDESTSELEKIEGLGTPKTDELEEKTFTEKFREPFFGEATEVPGKTEDPDPLKKEESREEDFAEQFMDDFEPVFEPSEDLQDIVVREKDEKMTPGEGTEDLAERVTSRVGHELQEVVEKVIKEKVPTLVRQEIDRLKKE